ncbi:helix-turn-helix transcriptional regulator [Streptomyces bluensis]|uniref:Response regulator transcription factor n=1 Tax=Streptomyces bluensis TaxID=33897 RepID=A0ABW6UGC5_9ACTN
MPPAHSSPHPATPAESEKRISVAVHARDPLSREGALSQLRHRHAIQLIDGTEAQAGDVAVLITETLDESAHTCLRQLVRAQGLRVVLVVNTMRESELLDVITYGVGAIVWRHEATASHLLQAVRAASRGHGALPSELIGRLINEVRTLRQGATGHPGASERDLTQREIDVLRLIADGWDTGEIAAKLAYSERTVKNIIHGLTSRRELRNRAHAVAHALREGYIS